MDVFKEDTSQVLGLCFLEVIKDEFKLVMSQGEEMDYGTAINLEPNSIDGDILPCDDVKVIFVHHDCLNLHIGLFEVSVSLHEYNVFSQVESVAVVS
jgi:hypothetical protein